MLRNRSSQLKLTKQCVRTVLADKLPLSIFDKQAMLGLIHSLTGGILPPSGCTVKRHVFQAKKKKLLKLKLDMNQARKVSLTFDCWSYTGGGYLAVTVHYPKLVSGKWVGHSCILHFKRLKVQHTAANILAAIRVALKKFEIEDKLFCVVTDPGSNVVKACQIGGIERSSCFGHCLHLSVTNGLKFWGEMNFDVEQTPECDSHDEGEPEQGTSREQCSSEIGLTEDDLPDIIDSDIVDTASDVYDLEEYDSDTETEWDEWASGANDFTEIGDSVSLNGALKKFRRTLKLLKKVKYSTRPL